MFLLLLGLFVAVLHMINSLAIFVRCGGLLKEKMWAFESIRNSHEFQGYLMLILIRSWVQFWFERSLRRPYIFTFVRWRRFNGAICCHIARLMLKFCVVEQCVLCAVVRVCFTGFLLFCLLLSCILDKDTSV